MRLIVAEPAGFCFGVRRAVDKALRAAARGAEVYSLGPLIHNPRAVERLEREGVRAVEGLDGVERGIVILRAHGAPPNVHREIEGRGVELVDATCPCVSRAQRKARALAAQGYKVIVAGEADHPEVAGILEWAGHGAVAISEPGEVETLPSLGKVGVVAQTTLRPEKVAAIVEKLRGVASEVRVEDTLCTETVRRQRSASEVASQVEVMVVVGGRNSSNTRRLVEICRETGTETHFVEGGSDLDPEWLEGREVVGLAAGASTPDWIIKEVIGRMRDIKGTREEEEVEKAVASGETEEGRAEEEACEEPSGVEGVVESCAEEQAGAEVPAGDAAEGEEKAEETEADDETADRPEPEAAGGTTGQDEGERMEERQVSVKTVKPGDVVKGKVVALGQDNVLVDVGYKSEGVVPLWELSHRHVTSPSEVVDVGDEINVYILAVDGPEGILRLSKKRADEEIAWEKLEECFHTGEEIRAPVIEEVKGGLIVDVGIRGFMPASHVERGYVSDLSRYVGREARCRVIEIDKYKNRVILSQKAILEEEYKHLREQTLSTIEEGQVIHGTVKSITDFGAFIDIGGLDGLLHVSEMSWGRVNHPSEVLSEGDEVDVMVLRVDKEREKVSLGLKQTLPDPWTDVEEKYPAGSIVRGKVVRVVGFGAFVEIEPGVEGLVHISQLAHRRVGTPEEIVSVGEEIMVKVLRVSSKDRRISLSLKDAQQEREKEMMREYMKERGGEGVTIGEVLGDVLEETKDRINERDAAAAPVAEEEEEEEEEEQEEEEGPVEEPEEEEER